MEKETQVSEPRRKKQYPVRWNLCIIVVCISLLSAGILLVLYLAIGGNTGGSNDFVIGGLIGLLGAGLSNLASMASSLFDEGKED